MIDKWFVNDIETALKVQGKAVVTDAKRLCGNLVGISINLGSMEIMAKWTKRKVM